MPTVPGFRLSNLDYLRGIAALGIMVYHYASWTIGHQDADTVLGRIGVYGVAVFYVLSGLTMSHVYGRRLTTLPQVRTFFVRRAFRIFPLLWIVTAATLLLAGSWPGWRTLLLNITGLFGFIDWDGYIAVGAWSIGNELAFYVLVPLLAFASRWRPAFIAAVALILGIGLWFAFFGLDAARPLAEQWGMYVNPLNQALLFVAGYAVGTMLRDVVLPRWMLLTALGAALLVFVVWPSGSDSITLVAGANRVVFSIVCVVICAVAYKLAGELPALIDRPLALLGEASYSVYLIHPIAFTVTMMALGGILPTLASVLIAAAVTIAASVLCYRLYERPITRVGRALTPTR